MHPTTVNAKAPYARCALSVSLFVPIVAIVVAACQAPQSRAAEQTATTAPLTHTDSLRERADLARIMGDSAAPLWLIVASDFQCPYCAQWHRQTQDAIRRQYVLPGKVRIAYLNFPLEQHPHARAAANAAMCAGAQNGFWRMHDAIFAAQERWAPLPDAAAAFDSLAGTTGIDIAAWRSCMRERVMEPVVAADERRAGSAGVQSTPTFLITFSRPPARPGHLIRGAAPLSEFRHVLDSLLGSATQTQ